MSLLGIAFLVPVLIAVATFNYFSQDSSFCHNPNAFRREVQEAAEINNDIINAREFPNKPHWWKIGGAHDVQVPKLSGNSEVPSGISTCVVFVHGYNTCFANSIRNGNLLWRAIQPIIGVNASARLQFFTFCWRGDVGASNFDEANKNAISAAPVFGSFLRNISAAPRSTGKRKLFIVTHSLGALVVLEALRGIRDQSDMPIIDTLVLVQPAVRVEDFGRGNIQDTAISLDPMAAAPPFAFPSYYNDGKYFDAVGKMTGRTIATASDADGVLGWAYAWWANRGSAPVVSSIANGFALGSVNERNRQGWTFPPNLEVIPLSPQLHLKTAVHSHGDLFDQKNSTLIPFLVQKVLAP